MINYINKPLSIPPEIARFILYWYMSPCWILDKGCITKYKLNEAQAQKPALSQRKRPLRIRMYVKAIRSETMTTI
jgi:hypothetical protein